MKTKKFFMLLAAVLLSIGAFAQSGNNEPLKGDVNGDGVVDYADIDAVIEIMKNAGGYVDSNYYWYVGQSAPSTTITEVTGAAEGWHKIGTTIGTYSLSNPLYNSDTNPISGSSNTNWYVAVPSTSTLGIYDSDDVNEVNAGNWTTQSSITTGNVTYNVYKSVGTFRKFNGFWIH